MLLWAFFVFSFSPSTHIFATQQAASFLFSCKVSVSHGKGFGLTTVVSPPRQRLPRTPSSQDVAVQTLLFQQYLFKAYNITKEKGMPSIKRDLLKDWT